MRKGKRPQRAIDLPEDWWLRLLSLCRAKWGHAGAHFDVYAFTKISKRSFDYAKKTNRMTEQLFDTLTQNVGFDDHRDLLQALGARLHAPRLATPIPTRVELTTKRANPQWADYRDYFVAEARPWALRCNVETESPYFRFGFKLLSEDGRVFGDGSIQSFDSNLVVHIGRNNWNRAGLGITAQDVFLTTYMNGIVTGDDQCLCRSQPKLSLSIELMVDKSYCAQLTVNERAVFRHVVSPTVCRRVTIYGWGDREEFRIDVANLHLRSILTAEVEASPSEARSRPEGKR